MCWGSVWRFLGKFGLVRYLKSQLGAVCKPPGTDSAPLSLVPTAYMKNDLCISSFSTTFLLPTYLLYASFHNYLLWGVAHQFPQPQYEHMKIKEAGCLYFKKISAHYRMKCFIFVTKISKINQSGFRNSGGISRRLFSDFYNEFLVFYLAYLPVISYPKEKIFSTKNKYCGQENVLFSPRVPLRISFRFCREKTQRTPSCAATHIHKRAPK